MIMEGKTIVNTALAEEMRAKARARHKPTPAEKLEAIRRHAVEWRERAAWARARAGGTRWSGGTVRPRIGLRPSRRASTRRATTTPCRTSSRPSTERRRGHEREARHPRQPRAADWNGPAAQRRRSTQGRDDLGRFDV